MNILFICTSNKDRSPALEKYFSEKYPEYGFRSAGVNRYFTSKKGTHYVTAEDLRWAYVIVCAEEIHKEVIQYKFAAIIEEDTHFICLNLGHYEQGNISDEYLRMAEQKLKREIILL